MSETSVPSSGGISVVGLLGVLFVGLKLTGFIAWSWWWVLGPFWIPAAVTALVILAYFIVLCAVAVL